MPGVVVTMKIKDGSQRDFEKHANEMAKLAKANEPGCLLWSLFKAEEPNVYVIMERYVDDAALAAHRANAPYNELAKGIGAFLDGRPTLMHLTDVK
jgi:quinol monooxygenase YgiN